MFPPALQARVCAAHPDLYAMCRQGYAALRISAGSLSARSALAAPFGHALDLDQETCALLGDPGLPA